ncbi:MAG: stage II sporulation protein M [Chitinophagaceae bacterium]|nr:stage II sporulation protein M [Chitinophagaceae bacterium]
MREAMFIKKNAEKWKEYQHFATDNPDETAERFITLIDDLSYAKTFYPKSKATRWINGIAASIYLSIYQNKKEKYTRVFRFWKYELPLLFKKYHKVLLFTVCVNVFFTAIGIWGSINDGEFIRGILGDDYVNMTEANIAKGDPFGVYKSDNLFSMFVHIGVNNIFVAFLMAIGGLLLGITTLVMMWQNCLMLGAFQYMFFSKGLGLQSIMVIWIHGTLEILAFFIASTASFVMVQGLLFPGTFKRTISFKRSVKDAMKIMLVLVPIFVVAAFLETYVTHLMSQTYDKESNFGLPVWGSAIILAVSLAFIVWYFVILPIRLNKKGYYIQPDGIINRLKK